MVVDLYDVTGGDGQGSVGFLGRGTAANLEGRVVSPSKNSEYNNEPTFVESVILTVPTDMFKLAIHSRSGIKAPSYQLNQTLLIFDLHISTTPLVQTFS